MLAAVILAAGESRRMGQPKALLRYQAGTFLEHLIEVSQHPRIGFMRIVLGAHANEVREKLNLDPAKIVINSEWASGQLSSIQAAIRSLPAGLTEGVILFLVDHPLISDALVASLIAIFESSRKGIVIPTLKSRRGHPVVFRSSLYEELLNAPSDVGARSVVWAHSADVLEVPTEEEGVVLNLNDPEALRRARRFLQ